MASEADFVVIHIPAAFIATLADKLVGVFLADLFAVFVESLALHRGMFHLFALHLGETVALGVIQEEVFQVILIIVPLVYDNLGITEHGVHVFAVQSLLV